MRCKAKFRASKPCRKKNVEEQHEWDIFLVSTQRLMPTMHQAQNIKVVKFLENSLRCSTSTRLCKISDEPVKILFFSAFTQHSIFRSTHPTRQFPIVFFASAAPNMRPPRYNGQALLSAEAHSKKLAPHLEQTMTRTVCKARPSKDLGSTAEGR